MWIARAVLALLLAAPYTLIANVAPGLERRTHVVRVSIETPEPTMGQLFFDTGAGYRERDSTKLRLSRGQRRYEFAIPSVTIHGLRLDPGTVSGRYTIRSVEVVGPRGRVVATLPLASLTCLNQLGIVEQNTEQVVLDSPLGSADPYFCVNVPSPLTLQPFATSMTELVVRSLGNWIVGLLCVLGIEGLSRRLGPSLVPHLPRFRLETSSPMAVLIVIAALATAAATYPLLLDGRSLVSPANGPVSMLYDRAPFVPGSNLTDPEDTRGSDVGALMWSLVPYSKVQRDALLHGEFPLWLRQNGSGRPLWAQGQSFLLDPLHWLTLVRADPALGWDLKFIAHRFVFSLGVGVAALLATGAVVPSAIAAALTPFAGLYAFRFNHPAAFTPSYAPWILAAWFLLAKDSVWRDRWKASLLLALATSLTLVAAPPKEGLIMIAGCHLTGALALATAANLTLRERLRSLLAAAAGGVISLLVTAPHWLVFLDTLQNARTAYDAPTVHLATLDSALGFVLGNLTPASVQPGLHPVAVALGLCAILAPAYLRSRRAVLACAISAICLTAVAFGAVPTPWLLRVPLVKNIGHFADVMMTALMVPTLVLAAGGVAALYNAGRVAQALRTAALLAGAVVLIYEMRGISTFGQFEQWVRANVFIVSICLPFTIAAAARYPGLVLPKVAVFASVVVLSELGGLHLVTDRIYLDKWLEQPAARVNLTTNSAAIEAAPYDQPTRAVGLGGLMFQGTQALYGLEGIGGPDPLEMAPYEELIDSTGVPRDWIWLTLVTPDRLDRMAPLLDLLNVGLVITPQNQLSAGMVKVGEDTDRWIDVARRPSAWPRAFFVDGVRTYKTPADLLALVREEGAPIAAVQADDLRSQRFTYRLPTHERSTSAATDYVIRTNSTSFRIQAPDAGVAVLTESYLKDDFRVTLNGKPVPYFRINHAFKGVLIPSAGVWDVSFEYRPRLWTVAWLCAAAGAMFALLAGWSMRPTRVAVDARTAPLRA